MAPMSYTQAACRASLRPCTRNAELDSVSLCYNSVRSIQQYNGGDAQLTHARQPRVAWQLLA